MIWVLVVQDNDGTVVRLATASYTPAGREALQERADRMTERAWVQPEEDRHAA